MSAPRMVTRALLASFLTVALVLVTVFTVLSLDVRERVRRSVAANLAGAQEVFTRVEARRQQDLRATVATLAENPTLKAALDTWLTERGGAGQDATDELLATVQREANKIADRVSADVLAVADRKGSIIASGGRMASAWPKGVAIAGSGDDNSKSDRTVSMAEGVYRVVSVPLQLGDAVIGSLELGTALDGRYARELADLSRGHAAILKNGVVLASTLDAAVAAGLAAHRPSGGRGAQMVKLAGESWAIQPLSQIGDVDFVALASIDAAAAGQTEAALISLAFIGLGAISLAILGSVWLARTLTNPIDHLSQSLAAMAAAERARTPVPPSGSSRELDQLTATFNSLLASVAAAEAEAEATYFGAVRALAAALDARDPYTFGHSERVSAFSVAIGQELALDADAMEILRLGALLHDIGKIGVPDEILRKPGALTPAEFEAIKAHPSAGARILRSIPFLTPHIPIVELHHERPDGLGYPYGLHADAIPLAASIVHVADAFDAMTSARAYRPGRIAVEAIAELRRLVGSDFDGAAVEALIAALPRLVSGPVDLDPAAFKWAPRATRIVSACAVATACLFGSAIGDSGAQTSRVALDTVVAVDGDAGSQVARKATAWFDLFGAVRIADGLDLRVRPVVFRRGFDGAWRGQMYELALRYERPGAIGYRLEAGQLPSPIGLSMLENRPNLNPVVSQHSTLYLPLPRFEAGTPTNFLLAASYPLGAQVTVSGKRWDARAAVTDGSPVRGRLFFGANKPPRMANLIFGAGVTPHIGVRIGASLAHGGYAGSREVRNPARGDRNASVAQVEGEWSFGHTRMAGEYLWTEREMAQGEARAHGGWGEIMQAIRPRWFVAARFDDQRTLWTSVVDKLPRLETYRRLEAAVGYRVTEELTLRGSYMTRKGYVVGFWDDQVLGSIVFAKKIK